MTENDKTEIEEFNPSDFSIDDIEETVLVRMNPEEMTLPVDTAAEVGKGFALINKLLYETLQDKYKETFVDNRGVERQRTKYHPWTLELVKERRRVLDQMWKMQGGEALNEARKESAKKFADKIFDMQDPDIKKKHKNDFVEVIEAEVDKNRNEGD